MRFQGLGGSVRVVLFAPWIAALFALAMLVSVGCKTPTPVADEPAAGVAERLLYHDARQLSFAGRRSSEAHFSADGRELVFQSERETGNPFDQIYRTRLATGETVRVSPGTGRASSGFFDPDGGRIVFASTHEAPDPDLAAALALEKREAGGTESSRGNFDPAFDLFLAERDGRLTPLAKVRGYDAEGAFSPDGRILVFASNRDGARDSLTPNDRERLVEDPSFFVDLYLLDLAHGQVSQWTSAPGYDGGPSFSADGSRIVWQHSSDDGKRAEIHSMRIDGSDERVLTHLDELASAPFVHPSGDYVIYSANLAGSDDFELYLVDAQGRSEPVRVTTREGFDGFPAFSPSGDTLVWTSDRTPGKQRQLFRAAWDDAGARAVLGLPPAPPTAEKTGALALSATSTAITATDFQAHAAALADPRTEGRGTGSPGEALAADYVVAAMRSLGLEPAGDPGSYRHHFEYSAGIALGPDNALLPESLENAARPAPAPESSVTAPVPAATPALQVDIDWRPLAFSRSGEIKASPVIFAGYGLVAPAGPELPAVDEYAGLDIKGRWVMVLRDLPQDVTRERRQQLQRYASLRHKTMIARDRGARGIVFVNGPRSEFREALVPLRFDAAPAGSSLAAASVRSELADRWLEPGGRSLGTLQDAIDRELAAAGANLGHTDAGAALRFELPSLRLAARIDLETLRGESHNVIGRLQVGARPSKQTIVLGAHLDHLGRGEGSGSLADASEEGQIHFGADDNASGVAVLLEIAEALAARRGAGEDLGRRDFIFAAWSGEELGLLGSDRWADENVNPHNHDVGPVSYLNFDMVGRLADELVVHGVGSSPGFRALLESAALPGTLPLGMRDDAYLPTDSTTFYTRSLPVLSAFTGAHAEYHTPRDRPELLNAEGAAAIAELFTRVAVALSRAEEPPAFEAQPLPAASPNRGGLRVFLGTIPDYSDTAVEGVRLSGVAPAGPAEAAGLRRGDTIVEVDGQVIENLYDFTYSLEALRIGKQARIVVLRDGKRVAFEVVPRSRD